MKFDMFHVCLKLAVFNCAMECVTLATIQVDSGEEDLRDSFVSVWESMTSASGKTSIQHHREASMEMGWNSAKNVCSNNQLPVY